MAQEWAVTKLASITVLAPLTNDQIGHNLWGMTKQHPIILILDRWPSRQAVADDAGVDLFAVHRWYQRKSINGRHDAALIAGAKRRKIRLSASELAEARSVHTDQAGHGIATIQDASPSATKKTASAPRVAGGAA